MAIGGHFMTNVLLWLPAISMSVPLPRAGAGAVSAGAWTAPTTVRTLRLTVQLVTVVHHISICLHQNLAFGCTTCNGAQESILCVKEDDSLQHTLGG